jgi:geranylgeranyl pyrophosphate synthase
MTETISRYGPVAADIPRVGERLRGLALGRHPLLGTVLSHLFGTEGKQLRPALVMLSGKLGVYDVDRLVTLAASLEVVHTATLVHDDTVDQALTRRGLKTVSALWNSKIAILVGDFLFAQSAHLAAQLDSVRIMALLSETVMAMSQGELRQYASSQAREIDESDYFQRIGGKTASLFAMCCEGAAIVSNQPEKQIEALREFGTNLGVAFQIVDDVLDLAGDEQTLGKPAGSDLREGTITLPAILLTQHLQADDPLQTDLRHGRNIDETLDMIRESGVLEAARLRAGEYVEAALSSLSAFPESEAKETLRGVAERTITRWR